MIESGLQGELILSQGRQHLQNGFCLRSEKGSTRQGKNLLPSKFFPFWVDSFSKGDRRTMKQTESHKKWWNDGKMLYCPSMLEKSRSLKLNLQHISVLGPYNLSLVKNQWVVREISYRQHCLQNLNVIILVPVDLPKTADWVANNV